MGAIVQTIGNGFRAVGSWLEGLLLAGWNAVLLLLDAILAVVVGLIGVVGTVIVGLFSLLLTAVLALIPSLPEADTAAAGGVSALAAANQYVPLAESLALLPVVATVVGGIGIYKLAKFIRGGG